MSQKPDEDFHMQDDFLNSRIKTCFGVKSAAVSSRSTVRAWNKVAQRLGVQNSPDGAVELRDLVLRFLCKKYPTFLDNVEGEVPIASAQRALQVWSDITTKRNAAEVQDMADDIKSKSKSKRTRPVPQNGITGAFEATRTVTLPARVACVLSLNLPQWRNVFSLIHIIGPQV
eukprot:PhM_4_TR10041/c3_g1_i11/m.99264